MGSRKLLPPYLSSLCMELSLILKAGIRIGDGFDMLAADESDRFAKSVLKSVKKELDNGGSVRIAMAATNAFPAYMTDMVEIGEKTGRLEGVFSALSQYYDVRERISKSVKNAVLYPAVLLFMLLAVGTVLITWVLPIFGDVYTRLGGRMSGLAGALMSLGRGLYDYRVAAFLIVAGIGLGALIVSRIPAAARAIRGFAAGCILGSSAEKAIGRAGFASAMALAVSSGLDTSEAIRLAGKLISDKALSRKISACGYSVKKGRPFGEALAQAGIFTPLQARMVTIGFRTGSADTVMAEIARRCEEEAAERIESALSRIEPTLVIIMSVFVGAILISVMLPLMTIMSAI